MHLYFEDGAVERDDLQKDLGEQTDRSSKRPEITKGLLADLRE